MINMNIRNTIRIPLILVLISLTQACSNEPDPFEDHLGYWLSYTDFGALEVMGSNGDYQFRYIKTDRLSGGSDPIDLTVSDNRLFWNPRGEAPQELKLIDGKLRLRFDRNIWDRSTKEEVKTIRKNNDLE